MDESWRFTYDNWRLSDPRDYMRDDEDDYGPISMDERDEDDYEQESI